MAEIRNRFIQLDGKRDDQARTVEATLSSETPVRRYGEDEILDHSPGAVDLTRAKDGLPLLFAHDQNEPIGVVDSVHLAGRKLRGILRFGNSAKAREVWADVKAGILRNLSIGYQVLSTKPAGKDAYRADRWMLYEASIVSVPADASVGIGRSFQTKELRMNEDDNQRGDQVFADERHRIAMIEEICSAHNIPRAQRAAFINDGTSLEVVRGIVLDHLRKHGTGQIVTSSGSCDLEWGRRRNVDGTIDWSGMNADGSLGLSEREARNFSISKAIMAMASGDWRGAGFEREVSDAMARKLGKRGSNSIFVPMEALSARSPYVTGTPTMGGNLVATNLAAESFVDLLRNKTQVIRLGAQMLTGLVGNVDIPKRGSATTAYWVSENAAITESEGTFQKVSLTPKTVGAWSRISRNMLIQATPAIELLVRQDMAAVLALAIDQAALTGSGSGTPVGILNTAGVGSVVGGTDGAAITLDHLIDLSISVALANADLGSLAYLINAKTLGALTKLKATTGQYLWERGQDAPSFAPMSGGQDRAGEPQFNALGYRVAVSNQLPSNLTKGTGTNLSALVFGNWSDLIIGEWGGLEIMVNPFGSGFNAGEIEVRAMQTVDIAVRHPESFAVMTDAIA